MRVRDGAVRLSGVAEPVRERSQLILHQDGSSEGPTDILPWGETWEWISGVRTPLAVEWPTLRQVLDWVKGETGLVPRLAEGVDPGILDATLSSLYPGSIDAQVANSLNAVPGDWQHRIEDGELWIEPKGKEAGAP